MRWRPAGRLLEEAGVALEEVDVEEEVEGQRAEVKERRQESPVLWLTRVSAVESFGRANGQGGLPVR